MPRRLRGAILLVAGSALAIVEVVAQLSSVFTPALAARPMLLYSVGSGGVITLLCAIIVLAAISLRRPRRALYAMATLYAAVLLIVQLTPLGRALQLALAGLTVGGSLLVLGGLQLSTRFEKEAL